MNSSQEFNPSGIFEFNKPDNPLYYNGVNINSALKQSLTIGTSPCRTSCFPQSRDSLESNGSVYEAVSIGETSFGGSFGHDETDGSIFGGKPPSYAADDAQVVPDFNEILETIHVDLDKSNAQSVQFITDHEASTDARGPQCRNFDRSLLKRRNSERDELEIYFPCVLTPIPVDRLYSTLVDDSTVFKFPTTSDEFLPEHKDSGGLITRAQNFSYSIPMAEGENSLESFGNFNVFSKLHGSHEEFDLSANTFELPAETFRVKNHPDSCNLFGGKDYNSMNGDFCYDGIGSQHLIEKDTPVSLSVTTAENNYNLQKSLNNTFLPKAVNIEDGNYVSKASIPLSGCLTFYGTLPFQLNSSTLVENFAKFPPTVAENTALSLSRISSEENFTNSSFDHNPAKELPSKKQVEVKSSDEASQLSLAENLNFSDGVFSEQDSSLYSLQNQIWKSTPRRERELERNPRNRNAEMKTTASPETASSAFFIQNSGRLKDSRRSKRTKKKGNLQGETRDFHNDMEKQRRTNMKTRFQNLRLTLPELIDNDKASKIVILQKAFKYIILLEQESIELENRKKSERQRNIDLLDKLQKITSGN
ncbi:uncharacterized protein LOC111322964 [Stylophora pistillata]|uniref:uncharacterized protein LOC111322964 n=1 Tax=Stylophora pistillata TaxID=50429 RepID=UPI000C04E8FD|nr:uncharacterized protein LOC111322964 [Stylophora pistillata]XP_022781939.1 uncharacterized protein LOC111322964 [Stylophora pistillata]XP_022781940.1 uncharacterized protein LOC111322964 [Stylophora pistillata]